MKLPRVMLGKLELPLVLAAGVLLCLPAGRAPSAHTLAPGSSRDPRQVVARPGRASCGSVSCAFIRPLLRPEQVPPLERPRAVSAAAASLPASELVLGVERRGLARAYPINLLRYHRVINDRLAGEPIAVAHSPISGASLCLRSDGLGSVRHSGSALEGDELLEDATGALWSPLLGVRVREPGREVPRLSCTVMRWSAWRTLHPRSEVASPARAVLGFDYRRDPWEWYRRDHYYLFAPVHYLDLRLPHKQEVLGVKVGALSYAFPLPAAGLRVLNTTIGAEPVLIVLDAESGFAGAYHRSIGGRVLELTRDLRDARGSRFNLLGEAVSGPLRGERLRPIEGARRALFFAWAAHHQKSIIAVDEKHGALTRRDEHAR